MEADLRQIAIKSLGPLNEVAEWYPQRSPGRKAILKAIRQIKLDYVANEIDKKKLILLAVSHYHTKAEDIMKVTGLCRDDFDTLSAELVDSKILGQTKERATDDGRGGRPVIRFHLLKEVIQN